jgi:hypothetical protein
MANTHRGSSTKKVKKIANGVRKTAGVPQPTNKGLGKIAPKNT